MDHFQPPKTPPVVAYLAPEIPALSATFVYEEILGLERLGVKVIPFSVHKPANPAHGQSTLAQRVTILYGQGAAASVIKSCLLLPLFGSKALRALCALASDIRASGLGRKDSWKLGFQFLAGVRLARALQTSGCTHLHIHFAHVPTQIGMYASLLSGIPFTVTAHANDIFERGSLLQRKAARAKRFLTISEHNVRYLMTQGIPVEQLAVVRCGVSLAPDASAKKTAAGSGSTVRIGSLGRMVEKKGFDVLIKAVAALKERGVAVQLSLAGDGPLRAELEALVQEVGIADATVFEGSMPHSAVGPWMKGLDIFVLACKPDRAGDMDGIPVVLMEAMSQSISVVSTRLSGIPELILHTETGLLAEPGDAKDMADQLECLIREPAAKAEMAAKAFDYVKGEFSQAVNLDRLLAYFTSDHNKSTPA